MARENKKGEGHDGRDNTAQSEGRPAEEETVWPTAGLRGGVGVEGV